ncbi:Fe-S cluster assembly protein SufD [Salinicoccus halodurans]|uniref:Fe-S cluster assembly protein SufD n=1 Tax=Salinicoccus halodurans TaxID=407035 RepID=A0A0F7HJL0_9STAP|nr:Fe-S cluster assembly protein SufD [Salinicoccus halodurans]AKG73267.1 Fe-S cluster assembly protein SufD [Salinicoccus halodurans]SFK83112.1 Fe-S cluster assembly protein SufD [Salinicoccus halodurans]
MATDVNEFVINADEVISRAKERGESELLISKKQEALDKIESLEMPKPDKTKLNRWDFFTVTQPVTDSSVYGSLEELPESVRSLLDIEHTENIYVQHNNTPAFLKVSDDLLDKGVIIENIIEASANHPELVEKYFMTDGVKMDEHKLAAYHAAMLNGGLFIYVPKNVQIENPVQMVVLHDDEKASLFNHVLIVADEGSELTYVENYLSGVDKSNEQVNIISEVIAKDNAKVKYGAVDFLAEGFTGYINRRGVTGRDADIDWALGLMNDSNVIYDNTTYLIGDNSDSDLKIVVVGRGEQKLNFTSQIIHYGKDTNGHILKHGVMKDSASSIFNGVGYIKHGGTRADAQQESRVLMLSEKARGDANPILLIDEDDVTAGHAASVGRVDPIQLFYLMSRGISQKEAERLVIHGFLDPVVRALPIESVKNQLREVIEMKVLSK